MDAGRASNAPELATIAGMVWAYRFDPNGTATALTEREVPSALAAADDWVWLHFGLADARCRDWLAHHAPVSELAHNVLVGRDEHLQLDQFGGEILGILPDLHRELGHAGQTIARLRFVMTERLLLSSRRTPLHSVEVTHRAIEAGQRFMSPVALIDAIVDQFADAVSALAQTFGERLDEVEARVLEEEIEHDGTGLGRIRLESVRVRRELGHLRTLFHRLEARLGSHSTTIAGVVRALVLKLDSIEHEMTAVYERARLLQDEVGAKMATVTNRRLFTLSVLTACLLPPTLVTGFFGMNTKDLPFQQTDGGTWFALLVAFAAGAATFWVLRRLRAL